MSFNCTECFDTHTIDRAGAEIACPYCPDITVVKLTGLAHGLGQSGYSYATVGRNYTLTTMTFVGRPAAILADVARVRQAADVTARLAGKVGRRNHFNSGARAIEARVRKILSA